MPNAKEVLKELNNKYNIIICSIGTNMNLSRKAKWINQYLPFIKNCILINNGNSLMDKSIVNMKDGILIDDVGSNLISSNAKYKICFGKIFPWNAELPQDYIRIADWKDIENYLLKGDIL
jgi:5'(3')-deoxyribonucleotidase